MCRPYLGNNCLIKYCGKCDRTLPRSDFGTRCNGQSECYCGPCLREYNKLRTRRHRDRWNARSGGGYTNDVLDWSKLPTAQRKSLEKREEKRLTDLWSGLDLLKRVEAEREAILADSFSLRVAMGDAQEARYVG